MGEIEKITDYGLGTYDGEPLVLLTPQGDRFHAHNHNGRLHGVTFTESFLVDGWDMKPCAVCFRRPAYPSGGGE